MDNLSIDKLRSPRSPRRSSGSSFFYPDSANNSGSSTPFISAPSSPRGYYFSAPPSPPRNRNSEDDSTEAAVPFAWEERPGTPKRAAAAASEFEFTLKTSVDHLSAMGFHFSSAPVSPQRDFQFLNGLHQVNSGLDDFEFSSARMSDAESVTSHADELFFQGQILPLRLPPRMQHKSTVSLHDLSPRSAADSFSSRAAAGSNFVHQLHSPKSPKSPRQATAYGFSLSNAPSTYSSSKSPRTKSPSKLARVDSPDENKHPSRILPQQPGYTASSSSSSAASPLSSVRKSLRELLHLNSSTNSSSTSSSSMKKQDSVKSSSGTDSQKSSRSSSSSSSSRRSSNSRSSSVSSNKSAGSARSSFSSKQVNPLAHELLQHL